MSLTVGDVAGDAFGNSYVVQAGTTLKKLNSAGTQIWSTTLAFAGSRVEVGTDNQPVMAGFPTIGSAGAAFWKTDTSGATLWSNLDADGPLALLLHARLLLDNQNNAYLAAGTLFEMAICKVRSDGTSDWTITSSGSYANSFTFDSNQNVYVIGGYTVKIQQSLAAPVVVYVFQENCASYLDWNPVAGAVEYEIYSADRTDGEWVLQATTTDTAWPIGCEQLGMRLFHVTAQ